MSFPYDYFDPATITDFTDGSVPLAAPGVLMTWLDFKNNILNRYPTREDFIANGTAPFGAYTRIFPNFPDAWDLMLMYEGNSFVFPEGHFGGVVSSPPYNHPPSPSAVYGNNFMGLTKIDAGYNNQEFSSSDYLAGGPPYVWGWEDNSGGIPPIPYFSGFTFDDSLNTTFNDCFFKISVDSIVPKQTGVSYGLNFQICIGSRVIDVNGLADWIYGVSPVSNIPIFGMNYPPSNPASTDILIPQHTIPPLKRRIPFQNYTQSIPRMIKK